MMHQEHFLRHAYATLYYRDPERTVFHRERGLPSGEYLHGDKTYCENDKCHRLDGPAYNWVSRKYHYLNGKRLFEESF